MQPEEHCPTGPLYTRQVERDSTSYPITTKLSRQNGLSTWGSSTKSARGDTHPTSICHQVQQDIIPVHVPSPGQGSLGSGCSEPIMGGHGRICLSSNSLDSDCHNKILGHNCRTIIFIAPGWPNISWFWDLVSLSSQIPLCLPHQHKLLTQPSNGSLHRELLKVNLHACFLESRPSESKVCLKWSIFVQWCKSNEVDFKAPSINQIADFLLYLYHEKKLKPLNGYRTAIAYKVGNSSVESSKDENLT